jgi:hypothetical protein
MRASSGDSSMFMFRFYVDGFPVVAGCIRVAPLAQKKTG